ncbi:MAG: DEAD/DEAH box helicase, partial [Bryobacteraceae bacterium]
MQQLFAFADVSLPVPLDRLFTYSLPESLRHRVRPGCRVLVPFGARRLTGLVLRVHNEPPGVETRDVLRLIDADPIFDAAMLELGQWVAHYYCAPLGEVLRAMAPLAADVRQTRIWALTQKGLDVARQLGLDGEPVDPATAVLRALEARPLAETTLERKVPGAKKLLASLERKGLVEAEQAASLRDPLRAQAEKLLAEFARRPDEGVKLARPERELLAYLELHPGPHRLTELEKAVKGASRAGRALARKGLATLRYDAAAGDPAWARPRHTLTEPQQHAFDRIRAALETRRFHAFLLHGVTGSGKTEVYLNAIEAALAMGRGALLLVPEIALTPAVAGQFHARFGGQVAILHSAFHDAERAEQWRRLRSGAARVGVGTRAAVFAPVRARGLVLGADEPDQSSKQE